MAKVDRKAPFLSARNVPLWVSLALAAVFVCLALWGGPPAL